MLCHGTHFLSRLLPILNVNQTGRISININHVKRVLQISGCAGGKLVISFDRLWEIKKCVIDRITRRRLLRFFRLADYRKREEHENAADATIMGGSVIRVGGKHTPLLCMPASFTCSRLGLTEGGLAWIFIRLNGSNRCGDNITLNPFLFSVPLRFECRAKEMNSSNH